MCNWLWDENTKCFQGGSGKVLLGLLFYFIFFILFYFLIEGKLFFFFNLFMAVLGPRFCARAFSSCGKRGPLFITMRGPLTTAASLCCRPQAPDAQAQ